MNDQNNIKEYRSRLRKEYKINLRVLHLQREHHSVQKWPGDYIAITTGLVPHACTLPYLTQKLADIKARNS